AALLFYLASPQQQLRASGPWPARHRGWPGSLCAAASLLAMLPLLAPMEAVFAWSVLLMLGTSLAPFLGLWRARTRAGGVARCAPPASTGRCCAADACSATPWPGLCWEYPMRHTHSAIY